jgi:negative modulator of initiation of replication
MTKTIEVQDSVYAALEKRVSRFGETPNDIIKRLLAGSPSEPVSDRPVLKSQKPPSPLIALIQSPEYGRMDGRKRYFEILALLYSLQPDAFETLEGFSRGSRVHFSRDVQKIETSGNRTMPKQLEGTPFFVLTNLDHKRKREMISDVMRQLGHPAELITIVAGSIPDSGISRSRRFDLSLLNKI